jgi:PAS domain S-box-containing protein
MTPRDVTQAKGYLLAVALCLLSLPIAQGLDAPSSCFILVVMASSLYGGRGPALLATLLASVAFELFFMPPSLHHVPTRSWLLRFVVFAGAMLLTQEIIERRKRSERARLELDEDFRSLAETSPDCIVSVDEGGLIQFANLALTKMFGFSIPDVKGKNVSLLLPSLPSGQSPIGEFAVTRKTGEIFYVEATCGGFGTKTTIFLRDISDRKMTQKKLEESEENLRLTLETIPGLVYTRLPDGTIEYANGRLSDFLGRTVESDPTEALSQSIHPDDKETVVIQIAQKFAGGLPYTMEYRSRRHDGVYRWLQADVQPLTAHNGEVIRWYALLTDVEELRTTEESLRRTQAKLAQAAQVAAVSELSASIVHEISQPLSAMVANGQACLRWLDATPPNASEVRAAVDRIVHDGKDAGEIIKGLRSLFRRSAPQKSALHLGHIVNEVASLVRGRSERNGIGLEINIPRTLPPILGDKIQLQQVLMNLVTNAVDSMQTSVRGLRQIAIRARQEGQSVLTEVEDSGAGITDFDSIFDSFFTTKEKGLGMGLSICRSIIEAHSGRIWGEPSTMGGTVFSFTVPIADGGELAA